MSDKFVEQGISVYQLTDCDWYAASGLVAAQECCANDIGVRLSDAIRDGDIEEDMRPSDLDENTITDTDENEVPTGKHPTYREALRKMIADGAVFPCWVWGHD